MPWSNNAIAKPSGASLPSGMAVDTNGDWLLLDFSDGVYRSTDDGANWTLIGKPSGASLPSGMAVDTNGDWLLLDVTDGVYRSTDDGANWTLIGKPSGASTPEGLAVDTNGDWLLLDYANGVYRSTDDGATWQSAIGKPSGASTPTGLAVDTNGDWLLLDYYDGVYRSTDDGANWTLIGKPSGTSAPSGMAVDLNGDWLLLDNSDGVYLYLSAKAAVSADSGSPTMSASIGVEIAAAVDSGAPTVSAAVGIASVSIAVSADSGSSETSADIQVNSAQSAPARPTGVRGTAGNGTVLLEWDAVTYADAPFLTRYEYRIRNQTVGTPWQVVQIPNSGVGTKYYEVPNLVNGNMYRFALRAVNPAGNSQWSNSAPPTWFITVTPVSTGPSGWDFIAAGADSGSSKASADIFIAQQFAVSVDSGAPTASVSIAIAQEIAASADSGSPTADAEVDAATPIAASADSGASEASVMVSAFWAISVSADSGSPTVSISLGVYGLIAASADSGAAEVSVSLITLTYLAVSADSGSSEAQVEVVAYHGIVATADSGASEVSVSFSVYLQRYVLEIDWDGDGNFANAHADVYPDLLSCIARRGRDYGSMLYGKSIAGILRATLRNDDHKYSRFNALSPLHNLVTPGRKVRLRIAPPGDSAYTTIWGGTLFEIDPQPRTGGNDEVKLTAYGPLADFTQRDVSVAMQAPAGGITVADAAGLVFTAAGFPTGSRGPVGGNRRMSRWWSPTQQAIKALRELEDTELGFLKETKDGKPALESENARLVGGGQTPQGTLTDDNSSTLPVVSLELVDPVKDIVNIVNVPVRTYQTGSVEVLWQLRETITLEANESLTIKAEYPGPNATRGAIGVHRWETLTATTDYTANTSADGTGTDVTARLSITTSDTATTRELTIRNTDTAAALVVTKLQCRGTAVIEGEPVVVVHKDQDSIDAYGEKAYLTPSQFISDIRDGLSYAGYLVSVLKAPQVKGNAVVDLTDHPTVARDLDLSDRMTLKTGGQYEDQFVEAIEHRLGTRGRHHVEVLMSPAEVFENVIVLDVGPGLGTGALGR